MCDVFNLIVLFVSKTLFAKKVKKDILQKMNLVRLVLLLCASFACADLDKLLDAWAFLRVENSLIQATKNPRQEWIQAHQMRKLKFEHDFVNQIVAANTLEIGDLQQEEPPVETVPETITVTPEPESYVWAIALLFWAPVLLCVSRRKRHRVSKYLA